MQLREIFFSHWGVDAFMVLGSVCLAVHFIFKSTTAAAAIKSRDRVFAPRGAVTLQKLITHKKSDRKAAKCWAPPGKGRHILKNTTYFLLLLFRVQVISIKSFVSAQIGFCYTKFLPKMPCFHV